MTPVLLLLHVLVLFVVLLTLVLIHDRIVVFVPLQAFADGQVLMGLWRISQYSHIY